MKVAARPKDALAAGGMVRHWAVAHARHAGGGSSQTLPPVRSDWPARTANPQRPL